ncbi:MAG: glycosyltransferase family 41 protein [Rhodospirillaceae bacterium]|nr:glycosyltransferase family 41 protein [Rhodospirillaceae bacterium]
MSSPSFDQAVQQYQAGNRAAAKGTAHALLSHNENDGNALNLLGILAQDERRWAEAEEFSRRAVGSQPDNPIFLNSLGNVLIAQGRTTEAITALKAAAAAAPNEADILFNLGNAYRETGHFSEAAEQYRKTIELRPGHLGAYNNLALVLRAKGDDESALTVLIEALAYAPQSPELRFNLGNAMQAVGHWDGAEASYRRALEFNPKHAEAMVNLGHVLIELGRKKDAEQEFRKAIALNPNLSQAYVGLADLVDTGTMDAVAHRRAVLAMKPDLAVIRSSLLMCLQYEPGVVRQEIANEHKAFGKMFDSTSPPAYAAKPRDFTPTRKLNIGVISGDLRFHAMVFFALPLFQARDRDAWSLTCYSTAPRPDAETENFRASADRWRDARHLDTAELVRLIANDDIDILIDLSGHTPHNRLLALAAKPATLQVAWGDYVDTRGLKAIDVLLGDGVHTPPADDQFYVERVVRLPKDYLCYRPPAYAPEVAPAPCLTRGYVTFGCFSEITKINPGTIARWAKVLNALPGTKLMINNRLLADGAKQGQILSQLMAAGIANDRILTGTGGVHKEFLAQYADVDVILDTTPYSGGLTTCEALLMGVPVLSVPGDRFCSRHATSHLIHGGYAEGVCTDVDDMVAKAKALVAAPEKLAALREGLRAKFLASPLCDVTGFAVAFYGALRSEWQALCARK